MVKILVFGMTENPGGIESVIMNYYRRIDRSRIQFDFLCNTEVVAYESEIKALGGTIYRIPARRDGRKRFCHALDAFMRQNAARYHAIWVNVCSLANIDYLKYARKYGIQKRIIHCHNADNGDSMLRGLLHRMNRLWISSLATDFWSCSDDASHWFYSDRIMRSGKYRMIYNAVDPARFLPDPQIRDEYRRQFGCGDKIVIGHIGRFHFQKNHKFVLQIFSELKKLEESAVLWLVGQGELLEEMKQEAKVLHIEKDVIFLGVRSDIPQLYQAMDAFLFPSVFEGLPVVLLEAQANGLPCLISDTIPKEIKVNANFHAKSLNASASDWAQLLLQMIRTEGRDTGRAFQQSPYNIEKQTLLLETLLLSGRE